MTKKKKIKIKIIISSIILATSLYYSNNTRILTFPTTSSYFKSYLRAQFLNRGGKVTWTCFFSIAKPTDRTDNLTVKNKEKKKIVTAKRYRLSVVYTPYLRINVLYLYNKFQYIYIYISIFISIRHLLTIFSNFCKDRLCNYRVSCTFFHLHRSIILSFRSNFPSNLQANGHVDITYTFFRAWYVFRPRSGEGKRAVVERRGLARRILTGDKRLSTR